MYQSLYRKYRPKNFNEVIGQEVVKQTLIHSIQNNKVSHAYLFTGSRGIGKTSIAKILAKTVNCDNLDYALICDDCPSCIAFNNKQNTDIIEIDAASNNGVDEIRELKSKINIVPSIGKYKVYIIDEVHMLTTGAFNALLKTLEEPPAHVIFILATTEPHKIPLTILSRCQRFDFKKIPVKQISEHLAKIARLETVNITKEALNELARLSDGGLRDAFSLLEQSISYSSEEITLEIIHEINGTVLQIQLQELYEAFIANDMEAIFKILDEYDENGKNLVKVLDEFINFLRNILLAKEAPNFLQTKIEDIKCYLELSHKISIDQLIDTIDKFTRGINDMKFSNSPRLNLELLFINSMVGVSSKLNSNIEKDIAEVNKKTLTVDPKKTIVKNDINKDYLDKIGKLIDIRVNNTLCDFNKKEYIALKDKIDEVNQYILDSEFSKSASIIANGSLKAANKDYFIFVYAYEEEKYEYYENIETIEILLLKLYNHKIYSIAVTVDEWNQIKINFNNQLKKYEYMEENEQIMSFLYKQKAQNQIEEVFGSIVQYN